MYPPLIKSLGFKFQPLKIRRSNVWQLSYELPSSQAVAQPLFDIGIHAIAIARKKSYQNFAPSKAPFHAFTLLLQGKLKVRCGKKTYYQKPGTLSFCQKDEMFQRYATAPTLWIYINLIDKPLWEPLMQHGSYIRNYESTELMLFLLYRIIEAGQTQTTADRIDALENSRILADLIKRELRFVSKSSHVHDDKLKSLVSDIQSAPEKPWNLSEMAKKTNLSPRTLNRIFLHNYGMGPMELVIRKRLDIASEQLIRTDDKIEYIASNLNYKCAYSFSNLFLRHVGMRPGEFRSKYRSERNLLM